MRDLLQSLKLIVLALVVGLGLNYAYAAWSGPTSAPPEGNTPAPINVGGADQYKTGGIFVGDEDTFDAFDVKLKAINDYNAASGEGVGVQGYGRLLGGVYKSNYIGVSAASSDPTGGYDFYGAGPQSRFAKTISSEYCFGSGAPGTDCITEWPGGGMVNNLILEGYAEVFANTGEDIYGGSATGNACDSNSGDLYTCSPSETKVCSDLFTNGYSISYVSDEGYVISPTTGSRGVTCVAAKSLVKFPYLWSDRKNKNLTCTAQGSNSATTFQVLVNSSGVPSTRVSMPCYYGNYDSGWEVQNVTGAEPINISKSWSCNAAAVGTLAAHPSAGLGGEYDWWGDQNVSCTDSTWE